MREFVASKNLLYYETSAKTGSRVRDMFLGVAEALTERTPAGNSAAKGGTRLEQVVESQEGAGSWKSCYC